MDTKNAGQRGRPALHGPPENSSLPWALAPTSPARAALLDEFEVHQAELEQRTEELRRARLDLEAARDEYQDLFDFAPIGHLALDHEGRIAAINLPGAKLLRMERSAIPGRKLESFITAADVPRWRDHLAAARQGDAAVGCELVLLGSGGASTPVQLTSVYRSEAADRRGRVRTAIQDISERRRTELALEEARKRLVDQDRRKADFLAVLSHELRNPLAAIRNSLWLLERAERGSSEELRARAVLNRQSAHLESLVDDLLDLTRISLGKFDLQRSHLDLSQVARSACQDVSAQFERRGIDLRCDVPVPPVWVDGDETRLTQLIGNLLANALKFTPPGGLVELDLETAGATCLVRVRDTGAGIESRDLERIFEPFVQAAGARPGPRPGLGIGLSLVRELAARHGGTASVSSPGLGQGAVFEVTLPLATPSERPGASTLAAVPVARSLSVLVVEDHEDAGETLVALLEFLGHNAVMVGTGSAGIERTLADSPDVLICDVGLPDMSGHEVIRTIRNSRAGGRPYAIALTGYAQEEDRQQAVQAGFDAHLPKPAEIRDLEALLTKAARAKSQ